MEIKGTCLPLIFFTRPHKVIPSLFCLLRVCQGNGGGRGGKLDCWYFFRSDEVHAANNSAWDFAL